MSQTDESQDLFESNAPVEPQQEMISVDAKALREVLQALISPGPAIRELQMLHGSSVEKITGVLSPISILVKQFNDHCEKESGA